MGTGVERSGTEVPIAAAPVRRPRAACVSESEKASRGFASVSCSHDTGIFSFESTDLHRSKISNSCRTSLDRSYGFSRLYRYATGYAGESTCALSDVVCKRRQRDASDSF